MRYDEESPSCLIMPSGSTGHVDAYGYWIVYVDSVAKKAHRLIWEMHNGTIPAGMLVDHKDNVRSNNRIGNLRLATHAENTQNATLRRDSSSGVKGVSYRRGGWVARVQCGDSRKEKKFTNLADAEAWAIAYRKEVHGQFARSGNT